MYRATSELYLDAGNFMKAVKYASKAIKLDTKEAYSYYWKGYVYYRNQDFKSALKYYEKAEGLVKILILYSTKCPIATVCWKTIKKV